MPVSSVEFIGNRVLLKNPHPTYYGMIVTGTALTVLGLATTIIGMEMRFGQTSNDGMFNDGAKVFPVGVVVFSAGVPTLIAGIIKQRRHTKWKLEHPGETIQKKANK